jgi:hypothetical protein
MLRTLAATYARLVLLPKENAPQKSGCPGRYIPTRNFQQPELLSDAWRLSRFGDAAEVARLRSAVAAVGQREIVG